MPRGWSAHHGARRKLATLVGPVEFERTAFVDELGRRRESPASGRISQRAERATHPIAATRLPAGFPAKLNLHLKYVVDAMIATDMLV